MTVFVVRLLKQFIPLGVAITVVCATVYLAVQQDIRLSANDPQVHFAEETAQTLDQTKQTTFRSPRRKINIATSLDVFTIIYDKNGQAVYSAAQLDNTTPVLPSGIFSYVKQHGEDRLTWQPKNGVRIAAVVAGYSNGYVLVGKNLRETEKLEDTVLLDVVFGWISGLVITFLTSLGLQAVFNKKKYM